jgi:hypothetical protein
VIRDVLLAFVVAAIGVTGCGTGGEESERFSENGVTVEIPRSWSVSGFSRTVRPPRLVAASYEVERSDVEGDCGGSAAIERLPRDGAYVALIDYGPAGLPSEKFEDRLPVTLEDGELANFECFGRSYLFALLIDGRAVQAHIGLGPDADDDRRQQALQLLNTVAIDR